MSLGSAPSGWVNGNPSSLTITVTENEPSGLMVTPGDSKLVLSWTAPTLALTGYDVHYTSANTSAVSNTAAASGNDPATAWVAVSRGTEASPPTASQTITGLSNGTRYRVRMRAYEEPSTKFPGAWLFATATPNVLASPSSLSVVPLNTALRLSWVAVSAATGYDVHYTSANTATVDNTATASGNDPAAAWVAVTRTGNPKSVLQDISGLNNGTQYRIRVRATNVAGNSAWSMGTGTPAIWTTLTVTPGDAKLDLSWTAPTAGGTVFGYDVDYTASTTVAADATAATTNNAATGWVESLSGSGDTYTQTSYTLSGLTNGTAYRVRVRVLYVSFVSTDYVTGAGTPKPTVSLSASPNPVTEGTSVTVTATLSSAPSSAVTIPVTVATASPNTAESGDIGTLTSITVNASSTTGTGTITTNQDADEDDETFTVSLGTLPASLRAGTTSSVQVTIQDDDAGTKVRLSASPNPVDEGTSVTVTVTLSEALTSAVTIPLTITDNTAESGDHGTLANVAIAAGSTSATGTITTIKDADIDDETFTIGFGNLPTSLKAGSPATVQVTITDLTVGVSLTATPNPVAEGGTLTVTATLAAALASAVTIPVTLTRGSAEAGDYGSLTSITVSAGATTGTGTIDANQDADSDDETFTVALGTLPSAVGAGSPSSVEITIDDDDVPVVSLMTESVVEGNVATITVNLSTALKSAVTIPLTLTAGTAEASDYGSLTSVTLAAGTTSNTGTIQTHHDSDEDDETITVALGTLPTAVAAGSPSSVVLLIVDDEGRPTVLLSASPTTVIEGATVAVTATLSKALTQAVSIPLKYGGNRGDTAEPGDYSGPASIAIAAGATSGSGTFQTNEDADGDNERVTIALGALPLEVLPGTHLSRRGVVGIDPTGVAIEIQDNETATVTLLATSTTVTEGEEVELFLRFSEPTPSSAYGADVAVRIEGIDTEPDGEDITAASTATVRVPAGETLVRFTLNTYRDTDTDDEQFTVSLRAADQYGWMTWLKIGSPSSQTITIEDSATETTPGSGTKAVQVSLVADSLRVEEGSSVTMHLNFSGPVPVQDWEEVTIPVNVTGIDTEAGDLRTPSHHKVRVGGGKRLRTFFIGTAIDKDTDDERFTVAIDTDNLPAGITAGGTTSLEIVITDVVAGLPGLALPARRHTAAFVVAENHMASAVAGELTIADHDGETRTFTLSSEDADHEAFTVDANGVLRINDGVNLDYERQATYTFTVMASGSANDVFEVTVNVTNVAEPPGEPRDLTAIAAGPDRIEVKWSTPADLGARLDGYTVQYKAASSKQWLDHVHDGHATVTTIAGLEARSAYDVRVRARGDGDSVWTGVGVRTTVAAPERIDGIALPDLTLVIGEPAVRVDAATVLTGDDLSFTFSSSDIAVASFVEPVATEKNSSATAVLQAEAAGQVQVTVTATNPGGTASVTFAVTVKAASDEEVAALGRTLDGLTRTLLASATGVISARVADSDIVAQPLSSLKDIDAAATVASLLGMHGGPMPASVGRHEQDANAAGMSTEPDRAFIGTHEMTLSGGADWGNAMQPDNGYPAGIAPGWRDMLWNRSFSYSLGVNAEPATDGSQASDRPSRWTVWGLGDQQSFSGNDGEAHYEGTWQTAYLGADRRVGERWLGGVALAQRHGHADYAFGGALAGVGVLKTELTEVYPYLNGLLMNGTELWAMLGAGTGAITLERQRTDDDDANVVSQHRGDLHMRLGSAGLRHAFADIHAVQIAVVADAGAAALSADSEHALLHQDSTTHRVRAGMEATGTGHFAPYLRLNGRYDGGTAKANLGYEGEAGLHYVGQHLDFDLRGRYMALMGDADYRETGAAATLKFKAVADGTGLFATLRPSWGRPQSTGFVWQQDAVPTVTTPTVGDPRLTLNAELGYGFEAWRLRGQLTPTLSVRRAEGVGDALRLGARYRANPRWLRWQPIIGFGVQRQQTLQGDAWATELSAEMRW